MFFENFAHGVGNSMNRPLTAPGDKLLLTEDLDQNRGLRCAPNGFGRLEVNLIIDLTAQYAKRFQIILPFANGNELERRPGRSEERRVGKECRWEGRPYKKK